MLDSAGAVGGLGLRRDASSRAVGVEVALVVHGLLKGVTFPAEYVVTVGGGTSAHENQLSYNLFSGI